MFSSISEEHHDSSSKGKPRSPKSQGRDVSINFTIKDCDKINIDDISTSRLSKNNDNISAKNAGKLRISKDLDISIEEGRLKDYRRIARTLQIAFENDPAVNYMLNTDINLSRNDTKNKKAYKRKQTLMISFFEYSVYECLALGGLVLVMKDNNLENDMLCNNVKSKNFPYLGVACWNRLEFDKESIVFDYPQDLSIMDSIHPSTFRFNLFSSLNKCRSKIKKDKFPLMSQKRDSVLKKLNLNITTDSVWYLNDIGILPSMRGKGLARELINYCLSNYVDVESNSWCYLESSNPINRKFYEKLGFVHADTYSINESEYKNKKDSIDMDSMFKYPKVTTASLLPNVEKVANATITAREILV